MGLSLLLLHLDLPRSTAAALLAAGAILVLVADAFRLRHPPANELFFRAFRLLASPREASGLASSTWYAVAVAAAVAFFPLHHAVSGILVLALADPAGSYVGQRWGRRPFLGGTIAGSLTFCVVAGVVLALRHPPAVAAVAVVAATLAERCSWPLDDNLTIPLVTGALTTLGASLLP